MADSNAGGEIRKADANQRLVSSPPAAISGKKPIKSLTILRNPNKTG